MKILVIHSIGWDDSVDKESAVDLWRLKRVADQLRKHTKWQIDEQHTLIKDVEKYKSGKEFSAEELDKAAEHLGSYDIIWVGYFSNPTFYTLLKVVQARYKTRFLMDVDDDVFSIKLDNPVWLKLTDENVYHMQCMVRDADFISTTTNELAEVFRVRREHPPESVFVIPNFISDDYQHEPIDNGEETVIGYFGGSSHYDDMHNTGVIEAIAKLMNENKKVRFETCGMVIDKYVPKGRYKYHNGQKGRDWVRSEFKKLNYDISIAPLEESIFAEGKSNIKWQESTRMGAVFVASNVGPYKHLKNGRNALLVNNTTEEWYEALKRLVDDHELRTELLKNARQELEKGWRLEDNWHVQKDVFEKIYQVKKFEENPELLKLIGVENDDHKTSKQGIIL